MFTLPELKPEEVLIYLRKSRTDDPALTVSEVLARHEQMLDDLSRETWGTLVPEENRFREVASGETIAARPEVQKVLRLIEQPRFRAVLIVEPQRLSRGDLEDIGYLVKVFRYTGTLIITPSKIVDPNNEYDEDYFEFDLFMSRREYKAITRRQHSSGVIRPSATAGMHSSSQTSRALLFIAS